MRKFSTYSAISVAVLVVLFLYVRQTRDPDVARVEPVIAYVAASDRRVYVLDLANGSIVTTSDPIDGLGAPTAIDFDFASSRLYIGSERGFGQNDYYPLMAVDPTVDFEVVGRYAIEPSSSGVLHAAVLNPDVHAVYGVVVPSGGKNLYVNYAAPGYEGTTVLDSSTGEIVRRLDIVIEPYYEFSPDGTQVASIWPSGNRIVGEEGQQEVREWSGGVAVGDIASGRWISQAQLVDDRGLQPPWQHIAEPLAYRVLQGQPLSVYDRDSGEIISSIDPAEVTGMLLMQTEPLLLTGSTHIALVMMLSAEQDDARYFVVVIDYESADIKSRIELEGRPTNIVLAMSQ